MRLIQFHIGGDEWFINPDNILHVHQCMLGNSSKNNTTISLVDESYITVDETLKTVVARINNQELNVAYDCMGEIERLKQKVKNLQSSTQPSE
jgi:archaellum component FlaC